MMMMMIGSGQSNLTTGRIAAAHGRFSGIRQMAPVCTPRNNAFLGLTKYSTQMIFRSVQTFFAQLAAECPYTVNEPPLLLSKFPLPVGRGNFERNSALDPV